MSSDPTTGASAGPIRPRSSAAAGEPRTTADGDSQSSLRLQGGRAPTADSSRLEVDFGNAAGTDRNNFMVIESIDTDGIRIAVSEPEHRRRLDGQRFPAHRNGAGHRRRSEALRTDRAAADYVDGPDNDVIDVYLDGQSSATPRRSRTIAIGRLGPDHEANAAKPTRPTACSSGRRQRRAAGRPRRREQGFYFDNVTIAVYNNIDGTGNDLDNVITGNGGDNDLDGLGGDDTLAAASATTPLTGGPSSTRHDHRRRRTTDVVAIHAR